MTGPSWIRGVVEGLAMDEEIEIGTEEADGWLVLRGGVPDRWKERAVTLHLVPLLPGETEKMLQGVTVLPGVSVEDERLLRLVAQGLKTATIARRVGTPLRTVERKLDKLRRQFDVSSTVDLRTKLAQLGFGLSEASVNEVIRT